MYPGTCRDWISLKGNSFKKKAATYHVTIYCMCSFLSVTLVCPPIGPPGMVLPARQGTFINLCTTIKKITYASGLNTSFLHTCRITVTICMSQFVYLIWYSLWCSWVKEHHGLCCSWELAEVSINEDGFCSCDTGHGLQVAVMPAVSLHVIVWYEGFASLCQSNYPDHLHFAFHLHISVVTIC